MLSVEDNELITRIGPGTAMGDLYRRFWLPVLLAEELPALDCAPVRLQVLGERLIAFKDSAGRVGVLDQRCPHRLANLFWGRNEEGGLRCAYHGWKYNVEGDCVDLPNAPEGSVFKEKIHAFAAYPAVERGGFVWTYMGPPDRTPEFPDFELNSVPESHRYISKIFIRGNYLQSMEGDIDSSHVSFLHSRVDSNAKGLLPEDRAQPAMFQDLAPRWSIKDTEYGMMLGAERTGPEGKRYWRINQWLMPSFTMIAARPGTPVHFQMRVPMDDESSIYYRVIYHPERPLTDAELHDARYGGTNFPAIIPGTFLPIENKDNDYLVDRAQQRTVSFSGIKSVPRAGLGRDRGPGRPAGRPQSRASRQRRRVHHRRAPAAAEDGHRPARGGRAPRAARGQQLPRAPHRHRPRQRRGHLGRRPRLPRGPRLVALSAPAQRPSCVYRGTR